MVARGGRVLTNAPAAIARALANTGSFPSQTVHTMHIPLGPWPVGATEAETKWIRMLGEMMRRNAFEFVHTLRPLVKTQGFSDEMIDKFIYGAQQGMLLRHSFNAPYPTLPIFPLSRSYSLRQSVSR